MTGEEILPGGFVNKVVRVGDTVRRAVPVRADFARRLLAYLERAGWSGAPRFLGIDEQGRQVLSHLDGVVPWGSGSRVDVAADEGLFRVARLVREFHDLTAGTSLAAGSETVCHNDLSPRNTVYRAGVPFAFIDWDLAAPGARIHDVAHVCWQYLGLGPQIADARVVARKVRLVCDAYGLTDRSLLIDTIIWWQERCRRGIEAAAASGDRSMIYLRDTGAVRTVRDAAAWVTRHRSTLAEALR
ncbi:phosphotransferase family protein [Microtetraspora fusca]|uniref:phosphotransferase family protein n=1 Tax=Microtetraspora fusca TaxID=1997 RepID=UPI000A701676|nr:phosphotransferase [Microtetraspora fusca]